MPELETSSKYSELIALGEEITEIYPTQIISQSKVLLGFIFNLKIFLFIFFIVSKTLQTMLLNP